MNDSLFDELLPTPVASEICNEISEVTKAGAVVLDCGMFCGNTIAEIASTDRGLCWLEWARFNLRRSDLCAPIATYLTKAPGVPERLKAALKQNEENRKQTAATMRGKVR